MRVESRFRLQYLLFFLAVVCSLNIPIRSITEPDTLETIRRDAENRPSNTSQVLGPIQKAHSHREARRAKGDKADQADDKFSPGNIFLRSETRGEELQTLREKVEKKNDYPQERIPSASGQEMGLKWEDVSNNGANFVKYPEAAKDLFTENGPSPGDDTELMEDEIFTKYWWVSKEEVEVTALVCPARKHVVVSLDTKPNSEVEMLPSLLASRIFGGWIKAHKDMEMNLVGTGDSFLVPRTIVFADIQEKETVATITDILNHPDNDPASAWLTHPLLLPAEAPILKRFWQAMFGTPVVGAVEKMLLTWKGTFQNSEIIQIIAFKQSTAGGSSKSSAGLTIVVELGNLPRSTKASLTSGANSDVEDETMIDIYDVNNGGGDDTSSFNPSLDEKKFEDLVADDVGLDCGVSKVLREKEEDFIILEDGLEGKKLAAVVMHPAYKKLKLTTLRSHQAEGKDPEPSYKKWKAKYRLPKARRSDKKHDFAEYIIYTSGVERHLLFEAVHDLDGTKSMSLKNRPAPLEIIILLVWCKAEGPVPLMDITFMKISKALSTGVQAYKASKKSPPPKEGGGKEKVVPLIVDAIDDDTSALEKIYSNQMLEHRIVQGIINEYPVAPKTCLTTIEIPEHEDINQDTIILFRLNWDFELLDDDRREDWLYAIRQGIPLGVEMHMRQMYDYKVAVSDNEVKGQKDIISRFKFNPQKPVPHPEENPEDVHSFWLALSQARISPFDAIWTKIEKKNPESSYISVKAKFEKSYSFKLWANKKLCHLVIQSLGDNQIFPVHLLTGLIVEGWKKAISGLETGTLTKEEKSKNPSYGIQFISILQLSDATKHLIHIIAEQTGFSKTKMLILESFKTTLYASFAMHAERYTHSGALGTLLPQRQVWNALMGTQEVSAVERMLLSNDVTDTILVPGLRIVTIAIRWVQLKGKDGVKAEPQICLGFGSISQQPSRPTLSQPRELFDQTKDLLETGTPEIVSDLFRGEELLADAFTTFKLRRIDLDIPKSLIKVSQLASDPEPKTELWPWDSKREDGPLRMIVDTGISTQHIVGLRFRAAYKIMQVTVSSKTVSQDAQVDESSYIIGVQPNNDTPNVVLISAKWDPKLPIRSQQIQLSKAFLRAYQTAGGRSVPDLMNDEVETNGTRRGRLNIFIFRKLQPHTLEVLKRILKDEGKKITKEPYTIAFSGDEYNNALPFDWKVRLLFSTAEVGSIQQMLLDFPVFLADQRIQKLHFLGEPEISMIVYTSRILKGLS